MYAPNYSLYIVGALKDMCLWYYGIYPKKAIVSMVMQTLLPLFQKEKHIKLWP
jgi:hypothetical protein